MISSKFLSFSLGILLSLHILCVLVHTVRPSVSPANTRGLSASSIISDVRSSLDGIREGLAGTVRFVERVSGFFEMIVSFAGFRAVMLLLAVMIIASLFSFMGIPRGGFSFFLSLLCADALWIAWHKSFQTVEWGFIYVLLKTNLILIAPFLVVSIFVATFRPVVSKTGNALGGLLSGILPGRKSFSRNKLVEMLELYRKNIIELENSLIKDIIDSGADRAEVSHRSKLLAKEVLRITGEICGKSGGGAGKSKAGAEDVK